MKRAIIGSSNRYLNGQPDIYGFVADMGRLPDNVRELVQPFVCIDTSSNAVVSKTPKNCIGVNEVPTYLDVPCSDNTTTTQSACEALSPPDNTWVGKKTDTGSGISYGWNGPYLTVSDNPANPDAYTDGWGHESTDNNYGWNYVVDTSGGLTIQSYGKDQTVGNGTDEYDADYPSSQPVISSYDWKIAISDGITISLQKPYTPAFGSCGFLASQASSFTTAIDCQNAGGNWNGTSSSCTTIDESSCKSVGGHWNTCNFTATQCAAFTAGAGTTWRRSCEFTKKACDAISGTLANGDSISGGWTTNNDCNVTIAGSTNSCPGALCGLSSSDCQRPNVNGTWVERCIFNDQIACETALPNGGGGVWGGTNNPNSCIFTTAQCFLAQGLTDGAECHLTHREGETNSTRYSENTCKTAKGGWYVNTNVYPSVEYKSNSICMKVFYRKNDGTVGTVSSGSKTIEENGSYQTLTFTGFSVTDIPIGINAIGIYEHNGTSCTANLYPADRFGPIPVLFVPHRNLPVIQW
jgi:hypothetical protein